MPSRFEFGGLIGLSPSSGWFVCCSFWSWSCSAGPVCVLLDRRIDREGDCLVSSWKSKKQSSLLFCPVTMYFFRGAAGSPSVSLWSCGRSARSIAADGDGKTFAATFYHCHWTGSRILPRSSLAKCSRTTKPVNRRRLGLGRRGCSWWTGPSAKCSWCALHVLRRLDFIARVARDRCVPFGDKQVVFAGDFFSISSCPQRRR